MMRLISLVSLAAALGTHCAYATVVSTENGAIVIREDSGKTIPLTQGPNDSEPVISPDGSLVVFTRTGAASEAMESCSGAISESPARDAELWSVKIDGSGAKKLLATKGADDVQNSVCAFLNKQYDIKGGLLYFETPAWATSDAIHVLDLKTGAEKFVVAGNNLSIVTCTDSPYADHITASQHRYFVQGGSYDWYYLFKPDGTEVGPFGEEPPSVAEFCGE